jgi:hypothetical protein
LKYSFSGNNIGDISMKKFLFSILIGLFLFIFGCQIFLITPELENPFIITLYWNDRELMPDPDTGELPVQNLDESGAVVEAEVTDEYGEKVIPEVYEWYISGELIKQGVNSVFLDNSMGIGNYWLDVIVGKDSILSSEHVDFIIME